MRKTENSSGHFWNVPNSRHTDT